MFTEIPDLNLAVVILVKYPLPKCEVDKNNHVLYMPLMDVCLTTYND